MPLTVYKANMISSRNYDELDVYEDSYLVEKDGMIEYVGKELPDEYR